MLSTAGITDDLALCSLSVTRPGQVFGLVGANGTGKAAALKRVMG
jgi:translation initiation factor RLI1